MRINLTKKDLVNSIYMQLGFSKKISENLIEDFFTIIFDNIKNNNKLKLSKFGTFSLRLKNERTGRNPKTKEEKKFQQEKLFYLNHQKNLKITLIKMNKSDNAYKTIGEVAKILGLKDDKKGTFATHTIRFWEKEFKQIKPKILNGNRRYFDNKNIDLLKKIKFLLKDQGMTINGVKKILESKESLPLDELANKSIKAEKLKLKLLKISQLIKKLKDNK